MSWNDGLVYLDITLLERYISQIFIYQRLNYVVQIKEYVLILICTQLFHVVISDIRIRDHTLSPSLVSTSCWHFNPQSAKLNNLNFHPLGVPETQLKMAENYTN